MQATAATQRTHMAGDAQTIGGTFGSDARVEGFGSIREIRDVNELPSKDASALGTRRAKKRSNVAGVPGAAWKEEGSALTIPPGGRRAPPRGEGSVVSLAVLYESS